MLSHKRPSVLKKWLGGQYEQARAGWLLPHWGRRPSRHRLLADEQQGRRLEREGQQAALRPVSPSPPPRREPAFEVLPRRDQQRFHIHVVQPPQAELP